MVNLAVFRMERSTEGGDAFATELEIDQAYLTKPTRTIGHANDSGRPGHMVNGELHSLQFKINTTNAVTYRLILFRGDDGASNTAELEAQVIWDSFDAWPMGCVDDVQYRPQNLNKTFSLANIGYMYYGIDYSAAAGAIIDGYIVVEGQRRAEE